MESIIIASMTIGNYKHLNQLKQTHLRASNEFSLQRVKFFRWKNSKRRSDNINNGTVCQYCPLKLSSQLFVITHGENFKTHALDTGGNLT
jgi:hypothetical protein